MSREITNRLATLLRGLDRDHVYALLVRLVQRSPELLDTIEAELDSEPVHSPPDLTAARLQMTRALHHPPVRNDRGWYIFDLGLEASQLLEQVWELIRAGDGRNAMDLLNAMTDECLDDWQSIIEDEEGETLNFVEEQLGPAWIEAILSTDLTPGEREGWESKLDAWVSELSEYAGTQSFEVALRALDEGWDEPDLQRILQGEQIQPEYVAGERYTDLAIRDRFTSARLNVLARQERYDEFLNLARAEGQVVRYTTMLVQRGQAAAAIEYGLAHVERAQDALTLAQELKEAGEPDEAARVAERGLTLDGEKVALGTWLADLAADLGRQDLALSAAKTAFFEGKNLSTYLRVQELGGEAWSAERPDFLDHLRQTDNFYLQGPVDIFLHERLVGDAIALLDRIPSPFRELIRQVANAAVETDPDWVIRTCRKQAEEIMNAGKSDAYARAADWRATAKRAYVGAAQSDEWNNYLAGLLEQHHRKYRLVPLLQNLSGRCSATER